MKFWGRVTLAVAGLASVWLIGFGMVENASAQAGKAQAKSAMTGKTAGEFFKNVTTSTLKGLSVDDFIGAMGVMSSALGYDCADCHPSAGSDNVNWVTDTRFKVTARKMVEMVAAINKTHFAGTQAVTCFTCHHGRDLPSTTVALDQLYGTPSNEHTDVIATGQGVPTADQTLDKYIQALGGAQRLATLKSYTATGTSVGYEGLGGGGSLQIFAQAPDRRATIINFKDHPERGTNLRVFNGTAGWIRAPRGLFEDIELTGTELDGARLDAQMAFPGQIKTVLRNWRSGNPDTINDREVLVVQGSGPRGLLATLYFDRQTGLLTRMVRYGTSPIGRNPTQTDYADYRDVGGIKFPFQYSFAWLDGRDTLKIADIKTNVTIDAARFAKP